MNIYQYGLTPSSQKASQKYEVYDVNTDEALHTFRNELEARWCAIDLNKPHLEKLYKVRPATPSEV
jgi:hypothetical protein